MKFNGIKKTLSDKIILNIHLTRIQEINLNKMIDGFAKWKARKKLFVSDRTQKMLFVEHALNFNYMCVIPFMYAKLYTHKMILKYIINIIITIIITI